MSREVDFTVSNFNNMGKIMRPSTKSSSLNRKQQSRNQSKQTLSKQDNDHKKNDKISKESSMAKPSILSGIKKYSIEPSFIPQNQKSQINEAFKPEIQELKKFLKKKQQKQKKVSQLIAQGTISREDLEKDERKETEKRKQQSKDVIIDEAGRARDKQGNLIFVQNRATQLKINQKKQQQKSKKELQKKTRIKLQERVSRNLFDRNLFSGGKNKKLRMMKSGLNFLQKGSYRTVEGSDEQQSSPKQLNDLLRDTDEIQNVKLQQGQQTQRVQRKPRKSKLIRKRARIKILVKKDVPNVQWWDQPLLKCNLYPVFKQGKILKIQQNAQGTQSSKEFLNLLQLINIQLLKQPITFQKIGKQQNDKDKIVMPMYLTKDQRKKLKRKKKREKLQQKNDKIKLGIIKPDKPKLKVSNMAVVMKDEFIMDPSKVQSIAKQEAQSRLQKHLQSNQSRKLTSRKKQEKVVRKLKRDSAKQCKRALFRVENLTNPSHLFKVNMNAKQLALNGLVIRPNQYHRQPVLIIIQGGAKAIKFYKRLMLNRIDWQEAQNLQQRKNNHCKLIWQGTVQNTTLGKWKNYEVGDEPETIRILNEKGIGHFWDYVVDS